MKNIFILFIVISTMLSCSKDKSEGNSSSEGSESEILKSKETKPQVMSESEEDLVAIGTYEKGKYKSYNDAELREAFEDALAEDMFVKVNLVNQAFEISNEMVLFVVGNDDGTVSAAFPVVKKNNILLMDSGLSIATTCGSTGDCASSSSGCQPKRDPETMNLYCSSCAGDNTCSRTTGSCDVVNYLSRSFFSHK